LGGLAIYIAFIITIILKKGSLEPSELGIILGSTIIVIGGVIDDIKDLKPLVKLSIQIVAAICLIASGVSITILTNPFGGTNGLIYISWLYIPFTVIWVVGITNALNLIDGLDGLAAGVALISTITIFIIAIIHNRSEAAILTSVLGGAIIGFLPYNFNPATIFMGDTGAQLLGFLLAAISMEGTIKSATAFAISVPILAIGLPIYDTIFAMIRRKVNGKPISQADRGHLHHRLLDLGLSQRQAVIIMYLFSAILGGIAIIAMQISTVRSYFLMASVITIIVFVAWKMGFFKHD
jgi:UDP-GlcNAc:undecaprenyl-phosphate GlcNAc-1-phosphate transferase